MPAVTQRIDNYLGGVSRQSDDKKKPGQVTECLNAYPDPTFGLTKRPGLKHIATLTGASDDSKWFYIHRDADEKYIGCIIPSSIAVTNNGTGSGTAGTYKNVALKATSGIGTGMTVDVTIAGGVATSIVLNTPGIEYLTTNTITIDKALIGNTTADVVGTLTLGDVKIWNAADGTACTITYDDTPPAAWTRAGSKVYEVGDLVQNASKVYRCTRRGLAGTADGHAPTATTTDIEYLTAWAANTNYSVGDKRVSNGRVYRCDTAGYSDRATAPWGGPWNTSQDINDPDIPAWKASTTYIVNNLVRNDSGKVYKCTASSGSSASSGGPTGTGSSITDGNVTWAYQHNYARWDYVDGTEGAARWDYVRPVSQARSYLQGIRDNFSILTVQDTTILTNDRWTVAKLADPTFVERSKASLILDGIAAGNTFNVSVELTSTDSGDTRERTFTMYPYTASGTASYSDILNAITHRINNLKEVHPAGGVQTNPDNWGTDPGPIPGLTAFQYGTTCEIDYIVSGTRTTFNVEANAGTAYNVMTAFQDQVANVSQLPYESVHGRVVKVVNTASANDTYFAKFVADNAISGTGHWLETIDPAKSVGLDADTMPHEIVNTAKNAFTFRQITWDERKVGDDVTNNHPSFVGKKIKQAFFHKNRLGFLSEDNVTMSRAGEFYNFYHVSAQTQTDADPVDISCATIRPAVLHSVIPTTQGLILFSKYQQFMMTGAGGALTPSTATVNAISNYEMSTDVEPINMGASLNFVSKGTNYSRVFGMVTRGQEENPAVADVGRVVNEWIPETIDSLAANPQNSLIALTSQSSDMAYLYRTYSDGEKLLVQAWFRWQLPGTIQTIATEADELFAVTKQASQFALSKMTLSQSPDDAILVTSKGERVNPCMDLYTTATNVIYNSTNEFTKCYIPWSNVSTLTPIILIKGTTTTGQYTESGVTYTPDVVTESAWQASTAYAVGDSVTNDSGKVYVCDTAGTSAGSGGPTGTSANITDGTARWDWSVTPTTLTYFKVTGRDLTSEAANIYVGWKFDMDVTLPKTYFKSNNDADYTASLTVARMKFAVGRSGVMSFKLKSTGRLPANKSYTSDGTTTVLKWFKGEIPYVDKDQIKVKINNVESTAFTAGDDQITLTAASSELQTLSGVTGAVANSDNKTFDLTYTPRDVSKVRVTIGGVATTAFNIVKNFINFDSAPASGTNNILVYSADDIVVYLDEWYNLNPTVDANTYLGNDSTLKENTVFTIPIHQKSDNFELRVWNDSPFPVALNSMMWEGNYTPRFYRRA